MVPVLNGRELLLCGTVRKAAHFTETSGSRKKSLWWSEPDREEKGQIK